MRKWIIAPAVALMLTAAVRAESLIHKLALDQPAPAIVATDLDGKSATLGSLKGKPIVLQFASITEPVFRLHAPAVEKLAGKYDGKATFVLLYQHEAHAADSDQAIDINSPDFALSKPTTPAERIAAAKQAIDRLDLKNETVLVDAWSDASSLSYGSLPNMTFLIDASGNLVAAYPWMDTGKVKLALDLLTAGKQLTPDLRGSVGPAKPAQMDYADSAMDMTGMRGPQGIGIVIDRLKLTDDQKQILYPALAQFLADVRDFREKEGFLNKGGVNGATASTQPKEIDPAEVQTALDKVHVSAQHLKDVCNKALSPKDAQTLIGTLDQGPGHRLFTQQNP